MILVAAVSGRALAATARRAGARVLVTDYFGDLDTRALAPWLRLSGSLATGIDRPAFVDMLRRLPEPIEGIVYGSGFEASPELLGEIASLAPLLGNRAETVARIKDERHFASLLAALGLPHPQVAARAGSEQGWLRKKRGGAGGAHVKWAEPDAAADGAYFQEFAEGSPMSALFAADGRSARVLGFSEQWTAPTERAPFRYGGCVGPVAVSAPLRRAVTEACEAITAATGLVGLNSLDMLVEGEAFTVLEINPRPGATLPIFDAPPFPSLWRCHLDGVAGRLPSGAFPSAAPVRAAAIVYAAEDIRVPHEFTWPAWITDIPRPRTAIAAGEPVCTVHAETATAAAARALAEARVGDILRVLEPLSAPVLQTT
jgi:predicted ATP-grasp superfamily ATP-dependent carboligase